MGLFDRLLNKVADTVGDKVGDSVGDALSSVVKEVGSQAGSNLTSEMKMQQENRVLNNKIASEKKMMDLEEEKKDQDLPSACPHCGAPTVKKIVCEYCGFKVIDF